MKEWISPIPRKVHLIWIGGEPPDYFKLFLGTFNQYMPEFEIKVWGNKELTRKNFPKTIDFIRRAKKLQGKQMIDDYGEKMYDFKLEPLTYSKWAQITDLMRLEIVFNHGGYYFDTTFEILKPMYNLLNRKEPFVGCNEYPRFKNADILSNSFFGAIKHSRILHKLLSLQNLNKINLHTMAVDFETGPGFLRRGITKKDDVHIFPSNYFYPFVEEYSPGQDPPYRKATKNKCHGKKKTKKKTKRLKNKKGMIEFPCQKYPKSYALKHWQLGKSWLITEYFVIDNTTNEVIKYHG
jgi:mannosyltransferase OCH1-like enzyme